MKEHKIRSPEEIDKNVLAEIPSKDDNSLYSIVKKNMIHGPCGRYNSKSPCMEGKKCTKDYPKDFVSKSTFTEKGGNLYRRRASEDGGDEMDIFMARSDLTKPGEPTRVTNRFVVPYNAILLCHFNCHINLETVHNQFSSIKYLFKYIFKGQDVALMQLKLEETEDEVECFQCFKYMNASQSIHEIYGFPGHERFPSVMTLPVHEEDQQRVIYREGCAQTAVENPPQSPLMAYFEEAKKSKEELEEKYNTDQNKQSELEELMENDNVAANLKYTDMPKFYRWMGSKNNGRWKKRAREGDRGQIARIPYRMFGPHTQTHFFMRSLLNVRKGVTSFCDLKTVNGEECGSYKEACQKLGLYHDDKEWDLVMEEAHQWKFSKALRELAANIIMFNQPVNPEQFLQRHQEKLTEDYKRHHSNASDEECFQWLLQQVKEY